MDEYIIYRWAKTSGNIIGIEEEAESLERAKDRVYSLLAKNKKVFYMKKSEFIEKHEDIYRAYLDYIKEKTMMV